MTFSFVCWPERPLALLVDCLDCPACVHRGDIGSFVSNCLPLPSLGLASMRARVRSDQRAQPRIRRYSSGFLSVTCKSISRLDLCYETDVSLVGGGVSTSHGVHIYVELSLTSIYTLRWNVLPPFEATFRPPQPSSSFSFASLFLWPCFAVLLFCLARFRRAPLVSGVSLV